MTEDAKKVWKVMKNNFGWSNQPKDFHLEYFEDIIKATKQVLSIADVVGQREQLSRKSCDHEFTHKPLGGRVYCWKCCALQTK